MAKDEIKLGDLSPEQLEALLGQLKQEILKKEIEPIQEKEPLKEKAAKKVKTPEWENKFDPEEYKDFMKGQEDNSWKPSARGNRTNPIIKLDCSRCNKPFDCDTRLVGRGIDPVCERCIGGNTSR